MTDYVPGLIPRPSARTLELKAGSPKRREITLTCWGFGALGFLLGFLVGFSGVAACMSFVAHEERSSR